MLKRLHFFTRCAAWALSLAALSGCESAADTSRDVQQACAASEKACGCDASVPCNRAGGCDCREQADAARAESRSDAALRDAASVGPSKDAALALDAARPKDQQGGLPCDVRALFSRHCWECHGESRKYGAPVSLVELAQLAAPAPSRSDRSVLAYALERVQSDESPMPPAPHARLSADEVDLLARWLADGAPGSDETCDAAVEMPTEPRGVPKPDDCEQTYEVRAHAASGADGEKFEISPTLDDRQYQCFYFDAPYGKDDALFWYEPLIDNARHIHHWILYATANKLHEHGSVAPCNSAEPGAHFIAGWGPGTDNTFLPSDVALQLQTGEKAGLVLELHYFNDTGVAQRDASGVRFCTGARTKRAHLSAVHTTGSEGICLEPGASSEVSGSCAPRTDMGEIHIAGLWPHMHKRARRMRVTVVRRDGARDVLHDEPFDFNAQLYYVKNDVVLRPGDTLETRCFYQNDTTARVHFGEGTEDEMCYAFITAWPAGALTAASGALGGLRTDLLNRCADPLSVLASCNGLADAL